MSSLSSDRVAETVVRLALFVLLAFACAFLAGAVLNVLGRPAVLTACERCMKDYGPILEQASLWGGIGLLIAETRSRSHRRRRRA